MSVYLNNAATTWPKPEPVARVMYEFLTAKGANMARGSASARDIDTLTSVFACRSMLAELFGGYEKANPKYVTLTSNVTESINIVLKGILKPNMRVITSSIEHNSVIRPLSSLKEQGVFVEVIKCSMKGYLDPASLDRALEEKADLVIVSHCSNVSGSLQDIKAISAVCDARGVPFVVDCAQTAGIVPIDAEKLKIAALCFTGHKGLFGPQGTGGIIWQPEFANRCAPFIEGGTGSLSHDEHQPLQMPDKFESGTPNLPGIAGLLAALEWIKETGMSKIREKEESLGNRLEAGLNSIKGLRILGPKHGDARLPVYALNIDGKDNAVLARYLSDEFEIETRPGLHCSPLAHKTLGSYPNGALRISPGYFNTEEEIDKTVEAISILAAR